MPITDDSKEKLKLRLSKAIGHLNSVYRMVDEKRYCMDVLHQLKAVQAALDKTAEVMLKQHLETCVVDAIQKKYTATNEYNKDHFQQFIARKATPGGS